MRVAWPCQPEPRTRSESPNFVTDAQVNCLAELLRHPTVHMQRCVEQLSFVPSGGHAWTRRLQVQVPLTATPNGQSWRVISLGTYARRRFPDFAVTDADGTRVNLVTRQQHGYALTRVALVRLLDRLVPAISYDAQTVAEMATFHELSSAMYDFFTMAGPQSSEFDAIVGAMTKTYGSFLQAVGIAPSGSQAWFDQFARDVRDAIDSTRYLCWINARPGEIINLQVTYTTRDEKHKLERRDRGEVLARFWKGIAEPRFERRKIWADWYRQLGIAPLNYEFSIPSQRHTGSYYFMVEPPAGSEVAYLDWETDNSKDCTEIDSAFDSAHIHNHALAAATSERGGTIRAYLRCSPHHHKQIIGATLLNVALVYILAVGRLPERLSESTQSLLLAVPSILTAYLVQQQKHYHAHATRLQRAILWGYLGVSVVFFLTIAFSRYEGTLGSRGLGLFATIITWLLGATSVGVCVWYLPQGTSFIRLTEHLSAVRANHVKKRLSREEAVIEEAMRSPDAEEVRKGHWFALATETLQRSTESSEPWRCYERGVHQYCSVVLRTAVAVALSALVAVILVWKFPPANPPSKSTQSVVRSHDELTITSWPSDICPGCNVKFRFVPTHRTQAP
jgi:hypothetical protein